MKLDRGETVILNNYLRSIYRDISDGDLEAAIYKVHKLEENLNEIINRYKREKLKSY